MAHPHERHSVLVVDDKETVRRLLYEIARKAGYEVFLAEDGQQAVEMAALKRPSVVIMDIKMPVLDGLEAFRQIHAQLPEIPVILMTAYGTIDMAVEAMKMGAFEYLVKPSTVNELRLTLDRACQMRSMREELSLLRSRVKNEKLEEKHPLGSIVGKSHIMQSVYKIVGRVAGTNATVLITGESGSGKELIAKTIHQNSLRREGPFIKVNCGALPENLIESELFGYEKGAFTGATCRKPGRFELADHGTLLLDEVGELSLPMQVKLLRVLQEREFDRVGGTETIKVDVRILASTNRNLAEAVQRGQFRDDLYYRLNVVPIHVPPLRERREDIPLFVEFYTHRFAAEAHVDVPLITRDAMQLLCSYHWPGNIRELANVIERAVILSHGVIDIRDLPGLAAEAAPGEAAKEDIGDLKESMRQVEKEIIAKALQAHKGNKVKTAQSLHISRRSLLYKVDEYGLDKKVEYIQKRIE